MKGTVVNHERLTIGEFARRVHRKKGAVYKWIRLGRMPPKTVVRVQGHLEVDWTEYEATLQPNP